jgi:HlyD family secretion protein
MPATRPKSRSGAAASTMIVVISAVVVLAGGAFFLRDRGAEDGAEPSADMFVVRRGGFDITVPASGELAAQKQTEVASRLEARATITEIVAEGTMVKKGDVLLRLNDEEILEQVKDARDSVNTAETASITAVSDLAIQRQSNASELAEADLAIRLAELAFKAWEEGTDVSTRRTLALDVETSQKDYDRLVARFESSRDLLAKDFISQDEYQRDEIAMIQARSALEQAKLAVTVYENYTCEKDRAKFESDLHQARDERGRIEQRHANEIKSLETDVESKAYQLTSRKERLAKYERQLELCVITAPQDGLVVYASSLSSGRWGRNEGQPPQIGDELRRNETVMILPDTSQMVAEVKVNEALSGRIKPGQTAVVYSDALRDTAMTGVVQSVGVLAESGGWRDPNRRDYTVRIRLEDAADLGLKPSMRCRSSIYVGRVDDAAFIPIQAVFRKGPIAMAYVPDGSGFAERAIDLGRSSELYIEVTDGLEVGETVLLREPESERITSRLESGERGPVAKRPGAPTQVRQAAFSGAGGKSGQRPSRGGDGKQRGRPRGDASARRTDG